MDTTNENKEMNLDSNVPIQSPVETSSNQPQPQTNFNPFTVQSNSQQESVSQNVPNNPDIPNIQPPQNEYYYQNPPYNQAQSYYMPNQPKRRYSDKVAVTFFMIIAVALLCTIIGFTVAIVSHFTQSKEVTILPNADFSQSVQTETPKNDITIATNPVTENDKALFTEQIAEEARKSCVGILVYSSNNKATVAGQGTGVIAKEDTENKCTYIITCAHVIDDKSISVKVQFEDGTVLDASVVAFDTKTDIGVIKLDKTGLNVAQFGDDTQLKVGSSVYAVGNPGGVEFFGSFTNGMVSAIDRPVDSEIGYTMKCIQHTAAINPGNSGGALVNVYGQVIGINSQKIASTEYEGMGFAIPISAALDVTESLINYQYVPNRAKLGITYYSLSVSQQYSLIARLSQLPEGSLIINEISADSSLAQTNAQQYDMIIAVDGKEMATPDVLLEKIDNGKVGDAMTLTLCRINEDYTLTKFDIKISLVEDKGTDTSVSSSNSYSITPYDFNF